MIRALLLVFLGAASFAAVYVALGPSDPEIGTAPQSAAADPAPAQTASIASTLLVDPTRFELQPDTAPQARPSETTSATVRNVTPENMTAAPQVSGALTRVETPTPPAKGRMELLFNPIVASAGTIKARDREVHLAGVAAPEPDRKCGEGAQAWPCGAMARAALRRFIRGRAIACEVPAGGSEIPDPANCVVGGENLSEWLVAQGWAEREGDAFETAEKAARDAKLGVWSDSRPDQADDVATSG